MKKKTYKKEIYMMRRMRIFFIVSQNDARFDEKQEFFYGPNMYELQLINL